MKDKEKKDIKEIHELAEKAIDGVEEKTELGKSFERIKDKAEEVIEEHKDKILNEDGSIKTEELKEHAEKTIEKVTNKADFKRVANGLLEIGAGITGGIEHGFGWLRRKLEEAKLK